MVLNYIWIAFFIIAFAIALVRLIFMGDMEVLPAMMNSTFETSKTAFEISLGLTGVLSLWLGIMKIGERGGVINVLSRLLSPVFTKLFPDIPKGHPVTGSIFMNIAANMLGLDNAATPLGLKAMEQLQELNPKKDTATNPMIMFLVLNTSGLTLIPVSIMVYRAQLGAAQPTDIFVPILLATFFSTVGGIIVTVCAVLVQQTSRGDITTLKQPVVVEEQQLAVIGDLQVLKVKPFRQRSFPAVLGAEHITVLTEPHLATGVDEHIVDGALCSEERKQAVYISDIALDEQVDAQNALAALQPEVVVGVVIEVIMSVIIGQRVDFLSLGADV